MEQKNDTPLVILQRRKATFEHKIAQERIALERGEFGPGPPAGYKSIPRETRHERLAAWEAILARINEELTNEAGAI